MIRPGQNIAVKVPLHRYDETVAFYRDAVESSMKAVLDAVKAKQLGAQKTGLIGDDDSPDVRMIEL